MRQVDPSVARESARAKAIERLGGIPGEYYSPVVAAKLPLAADWIVFTDEQPGGDGGFDHIFIFHRVHGPESFKQQLNDFFDGGTDLDNLVRIQVRLRDELGRGEFTRNDRRVRWVAGHGEFEISDMDRGEDGLVSVMFFDCPEDGILRFGIWQMRGKSPADLAHTVADPQEMQKIMGSLDPCRG